MVMVADARAAKEGTRTQYIHKSHAVVKGHQAACKQQTKTRDDRMTVTAKDNGVLTRNQVKSGRRVAIQRETNDHVQHEYLARRDGLCNQTGPSQQELTFIRVLRKRF